jgi:hypothetical protein
LAVLLAISAVWPVSGVAQDTGSPVQVLTDEVVVRVGSDVYVGPDDAVQAVVAVGGDAIIDGVVTELVVVVAGDAYIRRGAHVGRQSQGAEGDTTVVAVGGQVHQEAGSHVEGPMIGVNLNSIGDVASVGLVQPFVSPYSVGGAIGWAAWTVFFLAIALFVAGVMPRQLLGVRRRLDRSFFPSLGWGFLGVVFFVPVITVVFIVTIVGILVVIPWLAVVLPLLSLFAFIAIGAWLGDKLMAGSSRRHNLMLTTVVGVLVLSVLRIVPWAGWIVTGIVWLAGFGATYVAIVVWLRDRGRVDASAPPPGQTYYPGAPQPPQYPSATPATPMPGQPYAPSSAPASAPQPVDAQHSGPAPMSGEASPVAEPMSLSPAASSAAPPAPAPPPSAISSPPQPPQPPSTPTPATPGPEPGPVPSPSLENHGAEEAGETGTDGTDKEQGAEEGITS